MNETENKIKKVDNSSYRERFQFQLQVNDNIICQRYFKIPHYNSDSLVSEELYETLRNCVKSLKRDLESKSRIYLANTFVRKTKLTGFASKMKAYKEAKEDGASNDVLQKILINSTSDETYVENAIKEWDETEFVNYGDVTFKFTFMVDERVVYAETWDGSQYPKYVRNSVDITNDKTTTYPMLQLMNSGKPDLAVAIINQICDVCSNGDGDSERLYIKSTMYSDKKYAYSPYNREYVNSWRTYCAKKYGRNRQ